MKRKTANEVICPDCRKAVPPAGPGNIGPWQCQECDTLGHGGCFTNTDDNDVLCRKCRKGKGTEWAALCEAGETHSGAVRRYRLSKRFGGTVHPFCDSCAASRKEMIEIRGRAIIGHMGEA